MDKVNEKQTTAVASVRPTKKQRELLEFIDMFIREHGYSPSYREIMSGLNYTSVATVALHVGNLIKRGHLRKRDYSARSLEVVTGDEASTVKTNLVTPGQEKWLIEKIDHLITTSESGTEVTEAALADIATLVAALKVLDLDTAAQSFAPRLSELKTRPRAEAEV
jgi:repressor LexA